MVSQLVIYFPLGTLFQEALMDITTIQIHQERHFQTAPTILILQQQDLFPTLVVAENPISLASFLLFQTTKATKETRVIKVIRATKVTKETKVIKVIKVTKVIKVIKGKREKKEIEEKEVKNILYFKFFENNNIS